MSKYIVMKPIPVDGEKLPTGTVVNAAEWRNLRTLIAGRYLKPVEDASEDDVQFVTDEVVKPRRGRPPRQTAEPAEPEPLTTGSDNVQG